MNKEEPLPASNLIAMRKLHRSVGGLTPQPRKTRSSSTTVTHSPPVIQREKHVMTVVVSKDVLKETQLPVLDREKLKTRTTPRRRRQYRSKSLPAILPSQITTNDWDRSDIFGVEETGLLETLQADNEALVVVQEMKKERSKKLHKKKLNRRMTKRTTQRSKTESSSQHENNNSNADASEDPTASNTPSSQSRTHHSEHHSHSRRQARNSNTPKPRIIEEGESITVPLAATTHQGGSGSEECATTSHASASSASQSVSEHVKPIISSGSTSAGELPAIQVSMLSSASASTIPSATYPALLSSNSSSNLTPCPSLTTSAPVETSASGKLRVRKRNSFGSRDKIVVSVDSQQQASSNSSNTASANSAPQSPSGQSPLPDPTEKRPRVARRVSLGMMKSHSLTTMETKIEAAVSTLGLVTPRAKDDRKSENKKLQRKDKNRASESRQSSTGEASSGSTVSRKEHRSTGERSGKEEKEKRKFQSRNRSQEDSRSTNDSIASNECQSSPALFDKPVGGSTMTNSNASDVSPNQSSDRPVSRADSAARDIPSPLAQRSSSWKKGQTESPKTQQAISDLLHAADDFLPGTQYHKITVEELTDCIGIEVDSIFEKRTYMLQPEETHRQMLSRKFGKPVLNKYSDCIHLQAKEFYREDDELEGSTQKGLIALLLDVSQSDSYRLHLFLAHPHYIDSVELAEQVKHAILKAAETPWDDEETALLFYGLINQLILDWVKYFAVELSNNTYLSLLLMNINAMAKKLLALLVGEPTAKNKIVDVLVEYKRQMMLLHQVRREDEPFSLHWMKPPEVKYSSKKIKQLDATFTWSKSATHNNDIASLDLLEFHPDEFARQLTLIDHRFLIQLPLSELQMGRYAKEASSPCLHMLMENFNRSVRWIGTQICCNPNPKERRKIIAYFIIVAVKLLALQNYHGLMQIFVGLTQHPVSRMKESWAGISSSLHDTWKKIETLCSPLNNFKHLRNQMLRQNFPLLTPSNLFIKDLTFLEDGNTLYCENTDDKYFNLYRITQMGQFLECLKLSSSFFYDLKEVLLIKSFLRQSKVDSQKEIEDSSIRNESNL